MIRALYTAASGMSAQQTNLDTVANNLANSATTGFHQRQVQFQDMIYQNLMPIFAPELCKMIDDVTRQGNVPVAVVEKNRDPLRPGVACH